MTPHRFLRKFVPLAFGLTYLTVFLFWVNTAPPNKIGGLVEISPGVSARSIGQTLKEKKLIRSTLWWTFLVRTLRVDKKLKVGVYSIKGGVAAHAIVGDLVQGRGETRRVTLPEGWATWQIARCLEEVGVCPGVDFLREATPHEGFLFPETYFFEPGTPASHVVSALRGRFVSVWREVYQIAQAEGAVTSSGVPLAQDDRFLDADGRSWTVREAVTLASLIERETSRSSERAIVSAVYRNRLRKGMRLECDPTVQYALGVWKQPLFRKDLTVDSPYNTYRHRGLPPHPICSPGRASLEASLSPAKASWLYFVSDARGGHRFSATYADHRASVRLYRNTLKFLKKPVQ